MGSSPTGVASTFSYSYFHYNFFQFFFIISLYFFSIFLHQIPPIPVQALSLSRFAAGCTTCLDGRKERSLLSFIKIRCQSTWNLALSHRHRRFLASKKTNAKSTVKSTASATSDFISRRHYLESFFLPNNPSIRKCVLQASQR